MAILFEGMDRSSTCAGGSSIRYSRLSTPWGGGPWPRSRIERLDAQLAELVRLAGPEARVFLVSDHGAGSTTEIFSANAWLAERGYLVWKVEPRFDDESQLSPLELRDYFLTIDWSRTRAYARSASANGIYIR
jgi:predicted AlkP superfamily phosphohydrolase/phosphomutase